MNLAICDSVVEHRRAESEGLGFDLLWELRIFSLAHVLKKTKNHLSLRLMLLHKNERFHFVVACKPNTRGQA